MSFRPADQIELQLFKIIINNTAQKYAMLSQYE